MRTRSGQGAGKEPGQNEGFSCETKRAILHAARNRFLHYGFRKTTIDEIAAAAGVGKGTVYLYFDNKEDILTTLAVEVKRNITAQMQAIADSLAAPEERIRRMILAAILSVHEACHSFAHGLELVDELVEPRLRQCGQSEREAQFALVARMVEEGIAKGDFAPLGSPDETARQLFLAMVSFFPPYANPCHGTSGCRFDLERRANAMLDLIFNGLRRH